MTDDVDVAELEALTLPAGSESIHFVRGCGVAGCPIG